MNNDFNCNDDDSLNICVESFSDSYIVHDDAIELSTIAEKEAIKKEKEKARKFAIAERKMIGYEKGLEQMHYGFVDYATKRGFNLSLDSEFNYVDDKTQRCWQNYQDLILNISFDCDITIYGNKKVEAV